MHPRILKYESASSIYFKEENYSKKKKTEKEKRIVK